MTQADTAARSWRFELWHLFYLVALYAAAISIWGLGGVLAASLYLGLWLTYFVGSTKLRDARIAAVVAATLMIIYALASPLPELRSAARRTSCLNNIRQIVLAMHNYEFVHKTLPPAIELSDQGEPWHSWRLELTSYLDEANLFDRYRKDETWNGPNNVKMNDKLPWAYSCPANKTNTNTPYKLVTGPRTAFEVGNPLSIAGNHDAPFSVIVLIEDVAHPVPWLKPEDLSVEEAIAILSSTSRENCAHCIETRYQTRLLGNIVGMLDGTARFIPLGADPEVIRQAIDPHDGIEPDFDFVDLRITIFKWQGYIRLSILIFLLVVPIVLVGRKRRIPSRGEVSPR